MNYSIVNSFDLSQLVLAHVLERRPLSIARMSDGEEKILQWCKTHPPSSLMRQFTQEWRLKFGVENITCGEMLRRLTIAATESTLFAADGGEGLFLHHFPYRGPFAEIYFPNRWTREQRAHILEAAGDVIVVNRDPLIARRIERSPYKPSSTIVHWVPLDTWYGADEAVKQCRLIAEAPLVLCSCGPGSKHIVVELAKQGKVALDMGSGAPHFWCVEGAPECGAPKCGAVAKEQ